MTLIEDYALLSDCNGAALVSRAGSIDWLCWPRFDSPACFAALLGDTGHGRWQIAPADARFDVTRRYRDGSCVLETVFRTDQGCVAITDFMPLGGPEATLIRIVEGRTGSVAMTLRLKLRFDYGCTVPWVTQLDDGTGVVAIGGPDLVVLRGTVPTEGRDLETVADFTITTGECRCFVLSRGPSHLPPPPPLDACAELARTEAQWRRWSGRFAGGGPHEVMVRRSLITLKALTYEPTGGIVAAPTTSLPETLGGSRNWDYRYCWLRDATLTLTALLDSGYQDEAQAWIGWLQRSIAGTAERVQIMYGIAGERRLDEWQVPWLPGYEGAGPVRIGNQAAGQVQLDVYGEIMGAHRLARASGLVLPPSAWSLQRNLLDHLAQIWREPDEGIWEVRGSRRHFTFSKVMAWLAFATAINDAEASDLEAPLEAWRAIRDEIHALVCARGYNAARGSFVQDFDSDRLDASLLMIPVIGFLPADDPRVAGTVGAIEAGLMKDGLVLRYEPDPLLDGQQGREGAFLPCSFWLVNCLVLLNRRAEAQALFDRLLSLANDVGLLAEEYDTQARRQVGNFPQAFSHMALVMSARILRDDGHEPIVEKAKTAAAKTGADRRAGRVPSA